MLINSEDFLKQTFKEILDHSTRRNRGSDDQDLLLNDLERIEQIAKRGIEIINSGRTEYNKWEIEKINNKEILEAIDKASNKKTD